MSDNEWLKKERIRAEKEKLETRKRQHDLYIESQKAYKEREKQKKIKTEKEKQTIKKAKIQKSKTQKTAKKISKKKTSKKKQNGAKKIRKARKVTKTVLTIFR